MIPASSIADAACVARLRGLTSRAGLPSIADLEGFARVVLAQARRAPGDLRLGLIGDARLYLRARKALRNDVALNVESGR